MDPAQSTACSRGFGSPSVNPDWLVVQTKTRAERSVALILEYKGYGVFLPTYRAGSYAVPDTSPERVLFAGYLFCHLNPSATGLIVATPGVVRIVGGIEPEEIERLKTVVHSGVKIQPWPKLENGDPVEVIRGPLRGCRGIYVSSNDRTHFLIEVTILQRSVSVELDPESIQPQTPIRMAPQRVVSVNTETRRRSAAVNSR
jgi:transcriptional antiterminator NusG